MSLYSELVFGAAAPLPTGGFADVVGSSVSVRVEEEEMCLTLAFSGSLVNPGPGVFSLGFAVDSNGAGFVATSALPLCAGALLAGVGLSVACSTVVKLAKGEHKITLQADSTAATTIDGAVIRSTLSMTRDSNSATLGQGVNSKVQLSL